MPPTHRRDFLQAAAALAGALAATATLGTSLSAADEPKDNPAPKGSSNEQLRVAVVGVHGRGMSHVGGFAGKNNCIITTICDCDEGVIGAAMRGIEKAQGQAPKYEKDIRKVIENKDIDVIGIAAPNHWHALM